MAGYTFARDGAGYRFIVGRESDGMREAAKSKMIYVYVMGLFLLLALMISMAFLIFGAMLCGVIFFFRVVKAWGMSKIPSGDQIFTVTPEGLSLDGGKRISLRRINAITAKNSLLKPQLVTGSGVRTVNTAGVGNAMGNATALAFNAKLNSLAPKAWFVSIEHGGEENVIAAQLTEPVANGLVADIRRVLQGEPLE